MSKQQRWILLFALVVAAYGIGQYWTGQRSDEFRAVLLDFLPKEVQRIELKKGDQPPFHILKQDDRWLLSGRHINEEARQEAIDQLLKRLQAIRTEQLVSQSPQEWEEYGVQTGQGILVCLDYQNDKKDCVRIGRYAYAEKEERVEVYTRLENQQEIYVINGLPLSFLDGKIDFFRNRKLLTIEQPLQAMHLQYDTHSINAQRQTDSTWFVQQEVVDLRYWEAYLEQLESLTGQRFADDIDELSMDSLLVWQLNLYTHSDSIQLNCYVDSTKQQPYILHSSQFSKTWISSDSTGLQDRLLSPWRKWLTYE